ncbi:hypothetical protein DT075_09300 [Bacillus licheniformis]|nr:hypothetical protein DT075_09300 [Bacillus licheniformis]
MSEGFWDSVGNFLHISYTENERKRDEYKKLYVHAWRFSFRDVKSNQVHYNGMFFKRKYFSGNDRPENKENQTGSFCL